MRRSAGLVATLAALALLAPAAASAAPPANDDFAGAELLSGSPASVTGTNVDATDQSAAGEPDHAASGFGPAHSVWYRWTPPSDASYTIDTCGSSFDTRVAVYVGADVGSLSEVASNNDSAGTVCSGSKFGEVTSFFSSGTEYYIAVDTNGSLSGCTETRGAFQLAINRAGGVTPLSCGGSSSTPPPSGGEPQPSQPEPGGQPQPQPGPGDPYADLFDRLNPAFSFTQPIVAIPDERRSFFIDWLPYVRSRGGPVSTTGLFTDLAKVRTNSQLPSASKDPGIRFWSLTDVYNAVARLRRSGYYVQVEAVGAPFKDVFDRYQQRIDPGEVYNTKLTPASQRSEGFGGSQADPARIKVFYWDTSLDRSNRKQRREADRRPCRVLQGQLNGPRVWDESAMDIVARYRREGCKLQLDDIASRNATVDVPTISEVVVRSNTEAEARIIRPQRPDLALTIVSAGQPHVTSSSVVGLDQAWRLTAGALNQLQVMASERSVAAREDGSVPPPLGNVDIDLYFDPAGGRDAVFLKSARTLPDGTRRRAGAGMTDDILITPPGPGVVRVEATATPSVGKPLYGWAEIVVNEATDCVTGLQGVTWRKKKGTRNAYGRSSRPCTGARRASLGAVGQALCFLVCDLFPGARQFLEGDQSAEQRIRDAERPPSAPDIRMRPGQTSLGGRLVANPAVGQITTAPVIATGGGNLGSTQSARVVDLGRDRVALTGVISTGGGNARNIDEQQVRTIGGVPIIARDGAGLISDKGLGIIATDGASVIATGGLNVISDNGLGLIGQAGGNVISTGGGNVIATGGGN